MHTSDEATTAGLPDEFTTTRLELKRVATHVLARGRSEHGGRFGLRATATGIGTPGFGPDETVLRLAGTVLVREHRAGDAIRSEALDLTGRSLVEAATFAGLDLSTPFAAGGDTVPIGDASAPLALDPLSVAVVFSWYRMGAELLDTLLPALHEPTVAQLWPEHCDLALDAATGSGRATIGVCPGDDGVPEPYIYVGPWEPGRQGDPGFWNAPYGAVLTRSTLVDAPDALIAAAMFIRTGLDLLGPA